MGTIPTTTILSIPRTTLTGTGRTVAPGHTTAVTRMAIRVDLDITGLTTLTPAIPSDGDTLGRVGMGIDKRSADLPAY